jgi:DNA-directed RNA polymerase subunit alpha
MPTIELVEEITTLINDDNLDNARQKLESVSDGSGDCQWNRLQGRLHLRLGEVDKSIEHLEKAVEIDNDNIDALFDLAYTVDLHGEDERAMELYEQCILEAPMHVNAMINLAVIYEDEGRFDEAQRVLEQVVNHYPNHARARLFLKDVLSCKDMYYDEDQERDLEKRNAILDIPISDFELSVRSRNCLKKMNINTLGDLLHTTEADLLAYKNFGETSLNEIKAMLTQNNLRLGQELEESRPHRDPALLGQDDVDPTVLNKPVSELEFSVRSRKCLHRLGIASLGDLAVKTEAELLASKNFGQTSLDEVKLRLKEHGLDLRRVEGRGRRL